MNNTGMNLAIVKTLMNHSCKHKTSQDSSAGNERIMASHFKYDWKSSWGWHAQDCTSIKHDEIMGYWFDWSRVCWSSQIDFRVQPRKSWFTVIQLEQCGLVATWSSRGGLKTLNHGERRLIPQHAHTVLWYERLVWCTIYHRLIPQHEHPTAHTTASAAHLKKQTEARGNPWPCNDWTCIVSCHLKSLMYPIGPISLKRGGLDWDSIPWLASIRCNNAIYSKP